MILSATIVLWLSVFLVVLRIEAEVEQWWTKGGHPHLIGDGWTLLPIPFCAACFAAVAFEIAARRLPTTFPRVVFGTLFVAALAGALFVVKDRWLRVYASMEVAFALLFVGHTMRMLGDEIAPLEILQIGAGGYLIVRGLDHFKKGLDARREKEKPPEGGESNPTMG